MSQWQRLRRVGGRWGVRLAGAALVAASAWALGHGLWTRWRRGAPEPILNVDSAPMALSHAMPGQVLDVRPFGMRLTSEKTVALFSLSDLEVMRLVLPAGKSLPPHKVPGEITIHCLEGALEIELPGATVKLAAGELVFLAGSAVHGVKALADASALVTIVLKP